MLCRDSSDSSSRSLHILLLLSRPSCFLVGENRQKQMRHGRKVVLVFSLLIWKDWVATGDWTSQVALILKNLSVGNTRRCKIEFSLGWKDPWKGFTQYSYQENPMDRRNPSRLQSWGHKVDDWTEHTRARTHTEHYH